MASRLSRRAFTLIEVLVASGVLALIATGILATTWRLASFARDEAEHLAADAYCSDVMWAVFSQRCGSGGDDLESIDAFEVPDEALPTVTSTDWLSRTKTVRLLRRDDSYAKPRCSVEVDAGSVSDTVTVTLVWTPRAGETSTHSLTVTRAKVERTNPGGSSAAAEEGEGGS